VRQLASKKERGGSWIAIKQGGSQKGVEAVTTRKLYLRASEQLLYQYLMHWIFVDAHFQTFIVETDFALA
jgi:hypothetical protein